MRQVMPFPLRLTPETRQAAREMAEELERSLNWLLVKAVEIGLEELKAQKGNASAAGNN